MAKYKDYSDIDILAILDEYDIDYKESGKNIGQGWYATETCPFCDGIGYHLGIHKSSKNYSCFICGAKGGLPKLLKTLLGISSIELSELLKKYGGNYVEEKEIQQSSKVILPSHLTDLNLNARNYLENRGFQIAHLTKKYSLKMTGLFSKITIDGFDYEYKHRIFLPIYKNKQLVSFSGRDYTGASTTRYKHAPIQGCITPAASCLYNVDNVTKKQVILVEGPIDAWKMGDNSIATMGVQTTPVQIQELVNLNLEKLVILFDQGADDQANKLAQTLSPFINKIQVSTLFVGDPGDLSLTDAVKLKHYLINS